MKVRCQLLLNAEGNSTEFSPWLTLGKIYIVLGILKDASGLINFRLMTSDKEVGPESVGVYSSECFELIDNYQPKIWKEKKLARGGIEISPASWQSDDFWDKFYDRDPDALIEFKNQFENILEEEIRNSENGG